MTVAAWSFVWQAIIAATCVVFFSLNAYIGARAVRQMFAMFRELRQDDDGDRRS